MNLLALESYMGQYRSLAKAEVVWAIHPMLRNASTDPPRKPILFISTVYQGVATVKDAGENPVDKPKFNESGPRFAGHNLRQGGDLLLTLDKADTRRLHKITDEEIT